MQYQSDDNILNAGHMRDMHEVHMWGNPDVCIESSSLWGSFLDLRTVIVLNLQNSQTLFACI